MKWLLAVITAAGVYSACSVAGDQSGLESIHQSNVYGVSFTNYVPAKSAVTIVMTLGTKVIATSLCSYQVIGAPSLGGPVDGSIRCDDKKTGLLATFSLLPSTDPGETQLWVGHAYANRNKNGGEYGCFHDPNSKNFLDCYYKSPGEPPHAGGVSN